MQLRFRGGRLRGFAWAAVGLLLATLFAPPAEAEDWMTGGRTPQRPGNSPELRGLVQSEEFWRTDVVGQSATQPVVVGDTIYHLAGLHLWKISHTDQQKPVVTPLPNATTPARVNRSPEGTVLVSSSTPTYSPNSGVIYFGTAYGWLWAYDMKRNEFQGKKLNGCPVVSSPLVLNVEGRDVLIVADKNYNGHNYSGCKANTGRVYTVWNLDQPGETPLMNEYQPASGSGAFGGWLTPSPIPGGEPDTRRFLVGADGFSGAHKGKAMMLELQGSHSTGFSLVRTEWPNVHSSGGFAGSFASDGTNGYWVDTAGTLWGANLSDGGKPVGWSSKSIPVPGLINSATGKGFSNTSPALDVRADGTHLYVTLRNYKQGGDPFSLRGCGWEIPMEGCTEAGAPGAVVAIKPNGSLKWYMRFTQADNPPNVKKGTFRSINTSPLVISSRASIIFGDVLGEVHSYHLDSTNVAGGERQLLMLDSGCRMVASHNLLGPGELPARGKETWSQVSGVGVDPAMANGLLLVGVNYEPEGAPNLETESWRYGRLVAYRSGKPYNLLWTDRDRDTLTLKDGEQVTISGQVTLEVTSKALGELRNVPVPVRWFLVPYDESYPVLQLGPEAYLPSALQPNQKVNVTLNFTPGPEHPPEGKIVGVIDLPTLLLYSWFPTAQFLAAHLGLGPNCFLGLREAAEFVQGDGRTAVAWALDDNVLRVPYRKPVPIDLSVQADAPSHVDGSKLGQQIPVKISIKNHAGARVSGKGVPIVMTVEWPDKTPSTKTEYHTLEPYATKELTTHINVKQCDQKALLRVQLNMLEPRTFEETTYANNTVMIFIVVGECPTSPDGTPATGDPGTRTIIVPADCQPVMDPNDPRLCQNYAKSIYDW